MRYRSAREGRKRENTAVLTRRKAGTGIVITSQTAVRGQAETNSGGVFARERRLVIGRSFWIATTNGIAATHTRAQAIPLRIVTQERPCRVVTDMDGKYSLFGLAPITSCVSGAGRDHLP